MKIKLTPISHPDLGELIIEETLFPIGRSEAPFNTLDPTLIAHLSRRHARIFVEQENLYIADLGSRNGTRLNGKTVASEPARLLHGDRLTLAGHIDYKVTIESGERVDEGSGEDLLSLIPVGQQADQLPAIAISRFPYLIGKATITTEELANEPADAGAYLSRRHAHIFKSGGKLFLEDLASTNGSFINGEQLAEHARQIHDGDLLSFGGDLLCYRAELGHSSRQPEQSTTAQPVVTGTNDESGTVMVSSASSFLDIFCVESNQEENTNEAADQAPGGDRSTTAQRAKPAGRLDKLKTFGRELKEAFAGEPTKRHDNHRNRWLAVGVVLLLGALTAALYYPGKSRRTIDSLVAQEQYLEAATAAGKVLTDDPDNKAVERLATQAIARHMITSWLALEQEGKLDQAEQLLTGLKPLAPPDSISSELIDMMGWVTALQQFVTERGGLTAPLRMYHDEDTIRELLTWWNRDTREHRGRMSLLVNHAPAFKAAHDRTFSQLRSLRNEESVYLGAIDKLNGVIEDKLISDRPQELSAELARFARQYPRVAGIEALQSDLQQYLLIRATITSQDALQAAIELENAHFVTPLFLAQTAQVKTTLLPSPDHAAHYLEASTAWREGQLSRAIEILTTLSREQGGELAVRELQLKRRIISAYAGLQQLRDQPDFGEQVVRFYGELDPEEDIHFKNSLEQQFQRHRDSALNRADLAWKNAASGWSNYRREGGIRGLQRLEEEVSPHFTRQAEQLAGATASANYASGIYELLDLPKPPERDSLHNQLNAEMMLQRRSLEELSMVLSPEVLTTKLNILTEVAAAEQLTVD